VKRSVKWFNKRAEQNTNSRISELPLLMSLGPSSQINEQRKTDSENNKFFRVGDSEIGGEEVVG